jgi:hypothetical protein
VRSTDGDGDLAALAAIDEDDGGPDVQLQPRSRSSAHTSHGQVGHVDDFLVDDETWAVRYARVDTSNWIGGRAVLIAADWLGEISWVDGARWRWTSLVKP